MNRSIPDLLQCFPKGVLRKPHSLLAGDLAGTARVDHDGVRAHRLGSLKAFFDVSDAFQSRFRIDAGERDKVRRVQRQKDPVRPCLPAYFCKGFIRSGHPVSALIFIGIKPLCRKPCRSLPCMLHPFRIKVFGVPARSEFRCIVHGAVCSVRCTEASFPDSINACK